MGREIEYGLLTVSAQLEFPVRVHDEELCQEEALAVSLGKTPSRPLSLPSLLRCEKNGFSGDVLSLRK